MNHFILTRWFLSFLSLLPLYGFAQNYTLADTALAREKIVLSRKLFNEQSLEESVTAARSAKDIYFAIFKKETKETADAWHMIALYYYEKQRFDTCIYVNRVALGIREKTIGERSMEAALSLGNLGNALVQKYLIDEAIQCHQKALSIRIEQLGTEDNDKVSTSYNSLGNAYNKSGNFEQGEINLRKALSIRKKIFGPDSEMVAVSLNNLAAMYNLKGDYEQSIDLGKEALQIRLNLQKVDPLNIAQSYNNLSIAYGEIGMNKEAIKSIKKSIEIYEKLNKKYSLAQSLSNLGNQYRKWGDYNKSLICFQKSIYSLSQIGLSDSKEMANQLINISTTYSSLHDFESALSALEKSKALNEKLLIPDSTYFPKLFSNLGQVYLMMKDYNMALKSFETSISYNNPKTNSLQQDLAISYSNLGSAYHNLFNFPKAIEAHEKSVDLMLSIYGPINPSLAKYYSFLMESKFENNAKEDISPWLEKSLTALNYQGIRQISEVNSIPILLQVLAKATHIYRLQGEFLLAQKYATQAISAIDYQHKIISSESRNHLSEIVASVCSAAIATNQALKKVYPDSVQQYDSISLSFAERSKSFLLSEAINNSYAMSVAGIPDSLLILEQNLTNQRILFDNRIYDIKQSIREKKTNDYESILDSYISRLLSVNNAYDTLISHFESNYPKYYQAKFDYSTISVDSIKLASLRKKQTLIEYSIGDSIIYAFIIRAGVPLQIVEITLDFDLDSVVISMTKQGIYGYYGKEPDTVTNADEQKSLDNYTQSAFFLYQKIFEPLQSYLTREIVIIPDGILNLIPFEALLTSKPATSYAYQDYKFLLKRYQMSYCYSSTLLYQMQHRIYFTKTLKSALVMAPFTVKKENWLGETWDTTNVEGGLMNRSTLGPLPSSGKESSAIAQIWKGDLFVGDTATSDIFRNYAFDYKIIHLSTHGYADYSTGDYSWLAFSSSNKGLEFEKLYAHDLYGIKINADLVVLSACEMGKGALQRGEGIIGMTRALSFSGAGSLVTTLWEVKDWHTADITVRFHAKLDKYNSNKDEALGKAKSDYLDQNLKANKFLNLHPYFWAGLIAIGDMKPLR